MSSAFRVGDRVRFPLGRRRITGVITEDRGAIGIRGRHLYQVVVPMDPLGSTTFELPEDEIESVDECVESEIVMEKEKIEAYLIHGGLIAILRSNLIGGRNQPRVWLRPDSIGNVTHTFEQERGIVGGKTVPFMAVQGEKVFSPKREEVLAFLEGFRLERLSAEHILNSVGTAP